MNRDRLEVLGQLDRGEISAADALQAMRADVPGEGVVPEADSDASAVVPEFVCEMRELGYEDLSVDKLVQFKIHGVDRDYVVKMRELDA